MQKQLFSGTIVILASFALSGCDPYYYGQGYNAYYSDNGYQYRYARYGAYGGYSLRPAPYAVPQSLSQMSYNFVINLALNNSYEIDAGQLAVQRSTSTQVRQSANRLVAGNIAVDQDLIDVLQRNGTPVVRPAVLDPQHQAMISDLSAVQGSEFDRRFAVQQVVAHREAIAILGNYIRNGDNQALRRLAQQTLLAAQEGLQLAQRLPGAAGS